MTHAITVFLFRRDDMSLPVLLAFLVVLIGIVSVQLFRLYNVNERFTRWTTKGKAHDWLVVQASVDVATGVEREVGKGKYETIYNYYGVLSYFYKARPESSGGTGDDLQMGEFEKRFDSLDEAKEWANGCKGLTVKVHVNPRNPDESILLDEDVPGVAVC
jgi:hypothetical protein